MTIPPLKWCMILPGLAALMSPGAVCGATMTLQFSSVSDGLATNWANGTGEAAKNMAWGIVVDRDGDGLAASYAVTGVNYGTPTGTGQSLLDAAGMTTDDMLFMSPTSMVTLPEEFDGLDGAAAGQNVITSIASVPFVTGVESGDRFYLIWFDTDFGSSAAEVFGVPQAGESYGIFGDASFIVPGEGHLVSYASVFSGVDPAKTMDFSFAPEPSTLLLGLVGAVGLGVRRRR